MQILGNEETEKVAITLEQLEAICLVVQALKEDGELTKAAQAMVTSFNAYQWRTS